MLKKRRAYPHDDVRAVMWYSAVRVAATTIAVTRAFEADTGQIWVFNQNRSPIEERIDEATGRDAALVDAFIDWFNLNVWGEDPFNAQAEETDVRTLPREEI